MYYVHVHVDLFNPAHGSCLVSCGDEKTGWAELVAHSQGLADGKNELVSGVLCSEEAELV